MKKTLFILLAVTLSALMANAQTCIPNGLAFFSQGQVDSFAINYPNCTEVEGNLYFFGADNGTITNLNGLSQITTIGGDFFVKNMLVLQNLDGMENLTSVGGYIDISGNEMLNDISALDNLTDLGSAFVIANNPELTQVLGFNQLANFTGILQISQNETLQTIDGFNSISSVSRLYIYNNSALTDVNGLSALTTVTDYVWLQNNPLLVNFNASQISTITNYLSIQGNALLENLSGFDALTNIGTALTIKQNNTLTSLSDFSNLTTIGDDLAVEENGSLGSLFSTTLLSSLGGDLILKSNAALTDITGLSGLTKVNGYFDIVNNDLLTDLTGVNNMASVGYLNFRQNELLADLSPFAALDTIHQDLNSERNPSLLNFAGLQSLDYIGDDIFVGSPAFSSPGIQDFTGLEGVTTLNALTVFNNNSLISLNGLNNLTMTVGAVNIYNNNTLTDLSGLEALTDVGGLFVISNSALVDMNGLESLATVGFEFNCSGNESQITFEGMNSFTNVTKVIINGNSSLQSLNGLGTLTNVDSLLWINANNQLQDISGLSNVLFQSTFDSLSIVDNPSLQVCGYENICNFILTGGIANIDGNAIGCANLNDVTQSCFAFMDHTSLVGNVYADLDLDCAESTGDIGLPNAIVTIENNQYSYGITTDEEGNYYIPVLAGDYTMNIISPSSFWTPCFTDSLVTATATNDSITTDFFLYPQGDCPLLDWDMALPPLRICGSRTVVIDYCNYGTLPAEDVIFSVLLDTFMTIDSASIPFTVGADGALLFEIDTVGLFDCDQFTMSIFLDCDSVDLGDLQCISVDLMSEDLCDPDGLWDGSIVTASGYCENDSVYFQLKNIGLGDMAQEAQFRVDILIEDIVLLFDADNYQLLNGDSILLSYAIEGDGFRIEADQTPGHPIDSEASAIVPSCDNMINELILQLFPSNNGDPFSETFCTFAVNSFDPNIKSTRPVGVGDEHEIKKDWELDYTIEFQNTGNDVAYLVTIKDTLSENVDLTTIRVKGASHDFTWALNPDRELVFTFEDILLPDSTTNEPESHGFVQFSISPNSTILPGQQILNRAGIYFDFNDPIITNTVFHTIEKPIVVGTEDLDWCAGETFLGNMITADTSIQELTEFVLYDSIHLYRLNVLPVVSNNASANILVGEIFEGVLIESDTSFVIAYPGQNGCDSLVTYTVSALVDVDEIANQYSSVAVFPNPVDKLLYVTGHQNGIAQDWTLVNTMGKVIWANALDENEMLSAVDVSGFPSGIYWLRVKSEEGGNVWRVVVE